MWRRRHIFGSYKGRSIVLTKIMKIETGKLLDLIPEWLCEVKNIKILKPVEFQFGIFFLKIATFPRITHISFGPNNRQQGVTNPFVTITHEPTLSIILVFAQRSPASHPARIQLAASHPASAMPGFPYGFNIRMHKQ